MRILLDTTYLLPAIGVLVKGIQRNLVTLLRKRGYSLFVCDISIFELSAKGAKYVIEEKLPAERVVRGIAAIVHGEEVKVLPSYDRKVLHTAFKLKRLMSDFTDCLILSTAMSYCDILITEDEAIHRLRGNKEFREIQLRSNPEFKVLSLKEMIG